MSESKEENGIDMEAKVEIKEENTTEPLGKSISHLVKQDVVTQIIEIGFSKNVAEKSCLYTNSVLEDAIEWIYQHQNDPDFEKEERIVEENVTQNSTTLSPEEAKAKAKELQDRARKMHLQKQKELEEEQERNRVRITKEMAKAKKEMDEAEMKRYVEIRKREKKEAEMEKKRMLEQLARDKEEKFGKKFDPITQQAAQKEYTPYENTEFYLKAIKTMYPPFRDGDKTKNIYNLIKVALNNIIKNPTEEKFKKLKLTNPTVQERIANVDLAMKTLRVLGFSEEGEFMICTNPDLNLFQKVSGFLEDEVSKLD